MKSLQERLRTQLHETQRQSPALLPKRMRDLVRSVTGGDKWTAAFLRRLVWQFRWLIAIALIANIGAGIAEAATLGVFTLALNILAGMLSGAEVDTSGTVNSFILGVAEFFGSTEPILVLLAMAVSLQLARSALEFISEGATAFFRVWMESDLQRRVFKQLVNMRFQHIIKSRLGNLSSYISQVNEVSVLFLYVNGAINEIFIAIAYLVVLFWISWQFTLAAIVILTLLSMSVNRLRTEIRESTTRFVGITVRLNERIVEYLQGIRLVHIFAREDVAMADVDRLIVESIRPRRSAFLRRASIGPIMQSVTIIGVASILAIGYWLVSTKQLLLVGEMVAYIFVIYRLMPVISGLNTRFGVMNTHWPFMVRVAQLLNPEDKEYEYQPGQAIASLREGVEFRNVELRYPEAERNALNRISFYLPRGKMLALVGSSGSGKSSVVNLLLGLYRPTAGQILIDGDELQAYDLAAWRRMIGVVDQETLIFSNSIAENIRFGKPDATDDEVIQAARIANADEFIRMLPQGYATEVGDRGYRLSGGQRQRIAIARAIIHSPDLLFFDEATSALDSHSERLIQESLEELRKERTVVVIAHRLSTIVKADEILLMENGQILERGTHHTLLEQKGRYAAMWQLQADAT